MLLILTAIYRPCSGPASQYDRNTGMKKGPRNRGPFAIL